jgi:predicted alpha/beta-fold hydrolase
LPDSIANIQTDFPAFRPRAPWWGGDLQTLRNTALRKLGTRFDFPGERLALDTGDGSGDRLMALFNEGKPGQPLAMLIHGLTGCEGSGYMVNTARQRT